jgi:hypothetical protein
VSGGQGVGGSGQPQQASVERGVGDVEADEEVQDALVDAQRGAGQQGGPARGNDRLDQTPAAQWSVGGQSAPVRVRERGEGE